MEKMKFLVRLALALTLILILLGVTLLFLMWIGGV